MKLYTITIEERRRLQIRSVATDAAGARQQVRAQLNRQGRQAKILTSFEADNDPGAASGRDALARLMGREFLALGGNVASIGEWVRHGETALSQGRAGTDRARMVNASLALAGMRLVGIDRACTLFIANSRAFTFLIDAFHGTRWAEGGWAGALRAIEGATLSNLTFAGQRSRAVGVPAPQTVNASHLEVIN